MSDFSNKMAATFNTQTAAWGYRHAEGSTSTSEPIEREGQPGLKPNLSKIDRFGKASLHIADGRVLLPTQPPWLDIFLNEV